MLARRERHVQARLQLVDDGVGWGSWILMTVAMVPFRALAVVAVVAICRGTQRSTESAADRRPPMQILDERFARGEIDEEEYRTRSRVLRASTHQAGSTPLASDASLLTHVGLLARRQGLLGEDRTQPIAAALPTNRGETA